ncbi:MAG: hypothetical protein E7081_00390 [Bacteroidales bacterium]|nr:hypothetical protein [Bacteroidales bacterium]
MKKSLLSVLAIIGAGTTMMLSAADFKAGGLNYNIISSEGLTVETVEDSTATGAVVIPETVSYNGATYTVVQIAAQAFNNATGMTSVSIPSTITTIGDNAFNGCTGLTSISYNATGCSTMGSQNAPAFNGCTSVRTISIGDAVITIPAFAFKGLTALRSVTIPENITYIGNYAFNGCTSIAQVNFNATECNYMYNAFNGCTNTANVYIGDNVKVIPSNAFYHFDGLTNLTIGESVISIGSYAFDYCSSLKKVNYNAINCAATDGKIFNSVNYSNNFLTTVVIGDKVKTIPAKLFYVSSSYSRIKSITWGRSIEEIQENAFYGSDMSSITIPGTVKTIGDYAFADNEFLTEVKLNEGLTRLSGFNYCKKLATIDIPSTVTTIGGYAFSGCTGLQGELKLPQNLNIIGVYAFDNCTGLSGKLVIPDNVEEIHNYAFYRTNFSSLKLGKSIKKIDDYAFNYCPIAGELYLPESITYIGERAFANTKISGKLALPKNLNTFEGYAFANCTGLTSIQQNSILPSTYTWSGFNYPYFSGCSNITEVSFDENIQKVYAGLCHGLTKIKSVTIPEGVEYIGPYAFRGCSSLESVTLPSTLKSIGEYAFADAKFTEIKLPEGLTTIGNRAFYANNSLKSVTIPESVTTIGYSVFAECNNMISATYNATQCTSTYDGIFPDYNFKKMTIGKNVEKIPDYILSSPTIKVIEWNAKAVRTYAYYNLGRFENGATPTAILADSVTAFYGCNSPIIISYAEVPPALSYARSGATAYVPDTSAYLADANWAKLNIRQSVIWKGTTDGEKLSYTTNFPYELTLKEYRTKDGATMSETPRTIGDYQAVFTYMIEDMEFEMVNKFSISANTSNTIVVDPITAYRGHTLAIPFKMINNREFTALQCDIHLPAGVTAATDEYGDYMIELSSRKSNTHIVSSELQADGSIRVIIYSSKNYAFSGNEGDIFYLTVNIAADAEVGDKSMVLTNIRLTDSEANDVITNRNESRFTISNLILGDSNDDTLVTMGDVVNVVNYVLGETPEKFVFEASDVNADKNITMADVVMVVNAVLNGGVVETKGYAPVMKSLSQSTEDSPLQDNTITLQDLSIKPGETATLLVDLTNSENITAFQFDIKLPEGISIPVDEYGDPLIALTSRATNTHQVVSAYQEDGSLRVAAYSSKSRPFKGNEGTLVEITLEASPTLEDGTYNIDMSTIYIIKPDGSQLDIENFTHAVVISSSGIENVETNGAKEVGRYDIYGRLLTEPTKGVNIVKMSDGTTRKVMVKQ